MIKSPLTRKLVAIVDDIYLRHAGPVGSFICEEMLDNWRARDASLSYLNLPRYIDDLFRELPDNVLRKRFIEGLLDDRDICLNAAIKTNLDVILKTL